MNLNINPELMREIMEGGVVRVGRNQIYSPRQKRMFHGMFEIKIKHANGDVEPVEIADNIVVNEGLNHILDVVLHAATQITTWYVGIFEGNYTPVSTDVGTNIATNSTESTAYTEGTRQEYVEAAPSSQSITNSASPATFSINATKTIYGAFLISNSTKGGATGTLLAAARFATSRAVVSSDQILVTYTITAADA